MEVYTPENYTILKTIGKGTYGTVYLCEKEPNKEKIILKEISISGTDSVSAKEADNEIKIISKLSHPNIIQYYNSHSESNNVYILMEYASNGNLAEYMYTRRISLLPEFEILFFFAQILLGVRYIHSKNIIHRDLKAENILLTGKYGTIIKIGDFGIARVLAGGQKAKTVIGTPYYLAPELCDGQPYDTKTDVWALGCLIYELCTHKRAFEAETLTGLIKQITSGSVKPINADFYSRAMQDLIDGMLSILPEKRLSIEGAIGKNILLPITYMVYMDTGDVEYLHKMHNTVKRIRYNDKLRNVTACSIENVSELIEQIKI